MIFVAQTGGTLSDMWATHERSTPMAIFSFVAILGTILAPVYCGTHLYLICLAFLSLAQLFHLHSQASSYKRKDGAGLSGFSSSSTAP